MPVLEVPINPEALAWALRRARLGPEGLAIAVNAKPETARAWLEGKARPTYRQARTIAQRLRVSFGQLLIPPPEQLELPIPDMRRRAAALGEPSVDLTETIYDALRKRDWWREYRGELSLPFVGSFDWEQSTPEDVAEAIRSHIPAHVLSQEARSWEEFLRKLSERAEEIGILVLRRGIVGNNTHRPLDPEEFSGFSIADPVAPIILINTRDYVARCNFTFAHELAHIWLGRSALDDNPEVETRDRLERFCDRVAAELLVPKGVIVRVWRGDPREAAEEAARRFRVSVWVVARRARDLGLIHHDEYLEVLDGYYKDLVQEDRGADGGNFYRTLPVRNSPTFTKAVVAATLQGELSLKEAAALLNLSIGAFLNYLEKQSGAIPS